jgi:hypothetical protein
MNKLLISIVIVCAGVVITPAQRKVPRFGSYPAVVEKPRVQAIDFRRSPEARSFRTRLTGSLRGGVNFAGHYIVAGWGCGTGCISGAIIDARDGRVYWPEQFHSLATGTTPDGGYVDEPVRYQRNSRLLIITGVPGQASENGPDKPQGPYDYEWRNRLRQIRFDRSKDR